MDVGERFDSKVLRSDGCWLWTGGRNAKGYGSFSIGRRQLLAHRFSWERENGPVPEGLQLDHLCFNPTCVRPSHLEVVTQKTNAERRSAAITHCKRGHSRALYGRLTPRGKWECRECRRIAKRLR